MGTLTKRILSMVLALCLCFALLPTAAMTVEAATPDYTVSAAYKASSYYSALCNVTLTGNQRTDIVNVALSQVGYREGSYSGDYGGADDGSYNNYTEYNYWYHNYVSSGMPVGGDSAPWCATFVSWCAEQANIPTSILKRSTAASPYSCYFNIPHTHASDDYFPEPGDLVFYGPNDKGDHYHVGIVATVDKSTGYITTIEGNTNSNGSAEGYTVYRHTRHYQHSTICCYGRPNYETTTVPEKPTILTTTAYYAEGSDIAISWNAVSGNTYYWINIYKDGELVVNQSMGNETTYTLENAAKGEYTFAVSANNSLGTSGGSSYSFLVGMAPEVPTITTTATYYATGTDVTVNWTAVFGNTYYWVNIYKDEVLIVNETAGNRTSFTFEAAEAGAYKFVVSANNGAGNNGSAKFLFLVGQPPEKPVLSEVKPNYDVGDTITISWDPVVGNVYYWVTAYKDGEKFANQTAGDSTSYSIPSAVEGQYIIYVSANNGAGTSGSTSCKFVVGTIQYTVEYDTNGGANAPKSQTKNHGEDLVLSESIPTRTGYAFLGWATSSTATEAEYQPGDAFTIDSNTILYAVWEKESVTISGIEVASNPNKTVYTVGESLDTTGLTLKATYSDGSTQTITSGFTTSGFDSSTAGEKIVTVSYGGKTTTFTVTVEEVEEVDPNAPQIVVSNSTGMVGQQVSVTISIINNPGVASMMLSVGYDEDVLALVSVTDGGQLGTAVHSDNYTACPYTLTWANDLATENYTYNGEIVTLTFEVLEGAELGKTSVTVYYDYDNFDIFNVDGEEVWFEMVDGSVNVIDVLIGDVNSDGKVNTQDRMILTRYLAKWTGYTEDVINMTAADVNCDGKVNTQDRMILTRYLAKWTGYEELPYGG